MRVKKNNYLKLIKLDEKNRSLISENQSASFIDNLKEYCLKHRAVEHPIFDYISKATIQKKKIIY